MLNTNVEVNGVREWSRVSEWVTWI